MKRRGFVILALLLVASLMAALGTGAVDVFSAKRSSAMKIVNDSESLISISGDNIYAKENNGVLKLDFSNVARGAKGINPAAVYAFNKVFTITNRSEKPVYVWLESPDWDSEHNAGVRYIIDSTAGEITGDLTANSAPHNLLLWSTGDNFKNGTGRLAYVKLAPGLDVSVKVTVKTEDNMYGSTASHLFNWDHTVVVKANSTQPSRP